MSSDRGAKRRILLFALLVGVPVMGLCAAVSASAQAEKSFTVQSSAECVFAPGAFNVLGTEQVVFHAEGPENVTKEGQVNLKSASATIELQKNWGEVMHIFGATEARATWKSFELELVPTEPTVFQIPEKLTQAEDETAAAIESEKPLILRLPKSGSFGVGPAKATASEALKIGFDPAAGYTASGNEYKATGHGVELTLTGYNSKGEKVFGAAGVDCTTKESALITPPTSKASPKIGGTPQVGKTLEVTSNGEWKGSPVTSYTYLWERCSRSGTGCAEIKNSESKPVTTEKYTPVAADVGHMLRLAVTAHNAAGSGTAYTATTGVISGECTSTWEGPTEGEWTTASNWKGGLPGTGSVVCIASGKSVKLSSGTQQIKSLLDQGTIKITGGSLELLSTAEVSEASTIALSGGQLALASESLTSVGTLTLEHATLTGAGEITVDNSLTWGAGGIMSGKGLTVLPFNATGKLVSPTGASCAAELTLEERTLRNEGTTTFGEGNAKLKIGNGAFLENSGTFNLRSETGCSKAASSVIAAGTTGSEPAISNNGKFVKSEGSGISQVGVKLYTTYAVEAKAGTLELTAGSFSFSSGQPSENPAKWEAAEGAEIKLAAGKFEIGGEAWTTFGGAIKFTGGTAVLGGIHEGGAKGSQVTISGGASVLAAGTLEAGTATIESATLNGEGVVEAKTLNLNPGAIMSGTGRTVVTSKATLKSSCASPIHISEKRTLANKGELTFAEGIVKMAEHGKIENEGTFIANSETSCSGGAQVESEGSPSVLISNADLFEKTEKTGGTTTIAVPFENQGTVEAKAGTLRFTGGGNGEEFAKGAWKEKGGTIRLAGGKFFIEDEVPFEVTVEGATVQRMTYEDYSAKNEPPYTWAPYASTSIWNKPITEAEAKEVLSESSKYVAKISESGCCISDPGNIVTGEVEAESFPALGHGPDYGHPVYWAAYRDPLYKLKPTETGRGSNVLTGTEIHIPAEAMPADGTDGHMAIVQPNGEEYDLWQAHKPEQGHELEFSWGSRLAITGEGFGIGQGKGGEGGEATASDFGLLAGILRPKELENGEIHHPLFVVATETKGIEWPAMHNGAECNETEEYDGHKFLCVGTPPKIGQRLYFTLEEKKIKELALPPWMKTILTALHKYGGYIGDTGGGEFEVKNNRAVIEGSWGVEVESPMTTLSFKAQYEREHASEWEHKSEAEKEKLLTKFDDPLKAFAEAELEKSGNRITTAHASNGKPFYEFRLNLEPSEEPIEWEKDLEFIKPPAH